MDENWYGAGRPVFSVFFAAALAAAAAAFCEKEGILMLASYFLF